MDVSLLITFQNNEPAETNILIQNLRTLMRGIILSIRLQSFSSLLWIKILKARGSPYEGSRRGLMVEKLGAEQ